MRCPNDDADLVSQTKKQKGLTITYAVCPSCHGSWLDAFNANYLKTEDITRVFTPEASPSAPEHPFCPLCQVALRIYHGPNIPQNVQTWKCPNGHGYFFPKGELFKFKMAQEAKISYFKLWNVPFPAVASVLLVTLVLAVSLGVTLTFLSQPQTTVLEARDIIRYQRAFVAGKSVVISFITSVPADVTLHIGEHEERMETQDRLLHTALFTDLASGTYEYFFTMAAPGKTIQSDKYRFTIP